MSASLTAREASNEHLPIGTFRIDRDQKRGSLTRSDRPRTRNRKEPEQSEGKEKGPIRLTVRNLGHTTSRPAPRYRIAWAKETKWVEGITEALDRLGGERGRPKILRLVNWS